ncbi:CPBP family intramembrane glutamic endopeptidase [Salinimicrobium flavum]|uniref:CPBP family intramembrane glutamic endopeptidase n=1 Tax=Salinimicrobium flavum TaxID=1737065 RepID=A0ABW5IXK9_9FLAO
MRDPSQKLKLRLFLFFLLLPLLTFSLFVLVLIFFEDLERIYGISSYLVIFSYSILIFLAIKAGLLQFRSLRPNLSLKRFFFGIALGLILFLVFFIEKVILQDYSPSPHRGIYLLSAVVFAPLLEEIFSKKILFNNLLKIFRSKVLAISIVAVYFAILHYPNLMLTHFIIGFMTTVVYFRNRDLWQVVVIHAVYNLCVVLLNEPFLRNLFF